MLAIQMHSFADGLIPLTIVGILEGAFEIGCGADVGELLIVRFDRICSEW